MKLCQMWLEREKVRNWASKQLGEGSRASRRGRDKEDFVEERANFTGLYVQFYMAT